MRNNPTWKNIPPPSHYGERALQNSSLMSISTTTSQAWPISQVHAVPVVLPEGSSYDRVGIQCTSSNSGVARFGLYADNKISGGPGKLIKEFGTVSATLGWQEITIDWTCPETNLYWLAVKFETQSFNARMYHSVGSLLHFGTSGNYNNPASGVLATSAGSGLSDPFDALAVGAGEQNAPNPLLRVNKPGAKFVKTKDISSITFGGIVNQYLSYPSRDSNASASLGNLTPVADRLYARPVFVTRRSWLDSLFVSVTTAGTNAIGRFGIWDTDDENKPNKLIYDSGDVTLNSVAEVKTTVEEWFEPNRYWFGFKLISAESAPALYLLDNARATQMFAITPDNYAAPMYYVTGSGSSMDDPFPTGALTEYTVGSFIGIYPFGLSSGPYKSRPMLDRGYHNSHHQGRVIIPWHYFRTGYYIGTPNIRLPSQAGSKLTMGTSVTKFSTLIVNRPIYAKLFRCQVATDDDLADTFTMGLYNEHPVTGEPYKLMFSASAGAGGAGVKLLQLTNPVWLDTGTYFIGLHRVGTGAATIKGAGGDAEDNSLKMQGAGAFIPQSGYFYISASLPDEIPTPCPYSSDHMGSTTYVEGLG